VRAFSLGVVSQHRFDDSTLFLKRAIEAGRLGNILQADAYVKWHRTDEYYARPVKGSWAGEGGGALISQAIHQVDVLLHLIGAVDEVFGYWHLGATHKIESEDLVCAVMLFVGRNRRDPGRDGTVAGLSGADRDPRHERKRDRDRRPTDDVGCAGR
jgi:predicted dehydrogenase